eukprot:1024987-Pyramimonas_sp.AAC.1
MGLHNERWGFSRQDELGYRSRDHALALASLGGFPADGVAPEVPVGSLQHPGSIMPPNIGPDVWGGGWHRVLARKWARTEAQVILEGRAMVLVHLHKT